MTTIESLAEEPVGNQKRDPKRHSHQWCWLPGQACTKKAKAKREDDQDLSIGGSQEVNKETVPNPWCWMPGQVCTKAKAVKRYYEEESDPATFWRKLNNLIPTEYMYFQAKVRGTTKNWGPFLPRPFQISVLWLFFLLFFYFFFF